MVEPNTYIKPSLIHGLGLFADRDIKMGEIIEQPDKYDLNRHQDEWIVYASRTKKRSTAYIGGHCMVNHSIGCNTHRNDDFRIVASMDIPEGEEITENYHELPDDENPFKLKRLAKAIGVEYS